MKTQQHLRLGQDRQGGDRAAERHRAGVAHEDLGGERVVPEEADRGPDQRGGEDREVEVLVAAVDRGPGAQPRDRRDREEGEQRDHSRSREQPVEAVREVGAVGGAGDDEEQERVEEPVEVDVDVDQREVDLRVHVADLRHRERDACRDEHEPDHLPASRQAERAAPVHLEVVVREADQPAADGRAEHRQTRGRVRGEDEERDHGGDEDEQAAHRRRARLDHVPGRPFGADLLADRPAAQPLDELGAEHDGDHHRQEARDQDSDHCSERFSIAAGMPSRPTAREAFTSTASPGWSTSATVPKAPASGIQCISATPGSR